MKTSSTQKINFVPKGWGFEKWIVNNEEYCGKLLYFVKGKKCSWHYHKLKNETFYLESGKLKIYYGTHKDIKKAKILIMNPGDKFSVPEGLIHRIHGIKKSKLYEFSTTHYDSDSYRITKGD